MLKGRSSVEAECQAQTQPMKKASDIGGDLFGLLLQRFDIQAWVFLDDLLVFFPSFQEGLREEIAMPVRKRELGMDLVRTNRGCASRDPAFRFTLGNHQTA